jgi:AcrR family transcriptional regulator
MEPSQGRTGQLAPPAGTSMALDRRQRRRQQTIDEILDVAVQVMAEEGVAGLSLSEVARRMGIQPPSLYKYFPSKLALYDALFQRGARENLATFRAAAAQAEPGWAALLAGIEAIMRQGLDHQVVAQLLNWRPVPGFEPSPAAFAPSIEFVQEARRLLQVAVDRGELHPDAASEEGPALLSILVAGVMSQQLANQPQASWDQGRFTRLTPQVLELFRCAYPPQRSER